MNENNTVIILIMRVYEEKKNRFLYNFKSTLSTYVLRIQSVVREQFFLQRCVCFFVFMFLLSLFTQ